MGILTTTATAVKATCFSCGGELTWTDGDGDLCQLCRAEIEDDMRTQNAEVEELRRQRDELMRLLVVIIDAARFNQQPVPDDLWFAITKARDTVDGLTEGRP